MDIHNILKVSSSIDFYKEVLYFTLSPRSTCQILVTFDALRRSGTLIMMDEKPLAAPQVLLHHVKNSSILFQIILQDNKK